MMDAMIGKDSPLDRLRQRSGSLVRTVGEGKSGIGLSDEERRQLQEQLWQSQKLEILGIQAGGIA